MLNQDYVSLRHHLHGGSVEERRESLIPWLTEVARGHHIQRNCVPEVFDAIVRLAADLAMSCPEDGPDMLTIMGLATECLEILASQTHPSHPGVVYLHTSVDPRIRPIAENLLARFLRQIFHHST